MSDRELLQDALEVMNAAIKAGDWKVDGACDPDLVLHRIEARLAQPGQAPTNNGRYLTGYKAQPEPEPVAWQVIPDGVTAKPLTEMKAKSIIDRDGFVVGGYILDRETDVCLVHHSAVRWMKYGELFQILHVTAPPQRPWQGLTDEECLQNPYCAGENDAEVIQLARAIEAKLKEKNYA